MTSFRRNISFLRHGKKVFFNTMTIWERRKDLEGIELRVGLVQYVPYYWRVPGKELKDGFGFAMDLWALFHDTINFTSRCSYFVLIIDRQAPDNTV